MFYPPTMPSCPSHHAVLGGCALLHRVLEQHVAFGVAETHPARPPQPAGTEGVKRDPPLTPWLPSLGHQHPGWPRAGLGPLGSPCPGAEPGWHRAGGGPRWGRRWGRTRGEPSGRPGCKLGAFSAPFGSPGRSWKLVTTLLCKRGLEARKSRRNRSGKEGGKERGEERLSRRQRAAGEGTAGTGGLRWQRPASARQLGHGAARRLCPAVPTSPSPGAGPGAVCLRSSPGGKGVRPCRRHAEMPAARKHRRTPSMLPPSPNLSPPPPQQGEAVTAQGVSRGGETEARAHLHPVFRGLTARS